MISHLIDTDRIIDFLKGDEKTVEKLISLLDEGLAVSVISLAELYEGVYGSDNPEKSMKGLNDFLTNVTILDVDSEISRVFGNKRASLRKEGKLIDNFDLLIAATCMHYDITLITNNTRHFEKIEGLNILRF
jgi:tRNA(fMet)-specific endonuclease VapC